MEQEFLIVDFEPQKSAEVEKFALRQALIGNKEAVEPSEIKYATENEYSQRLIVRADDAEKSVFDGNTLLFAVDKEYEPRAISVVLYNDETGSIKAIDPIIELAGANEELVQPQVQEQVEAHEQDETSHEDSEQESKSEDSIEQTIDTIVPSVGDLYQRVNEPLHIDEKFLTDREVLSSKTQLETSLMTIRYILGKEIDELIRDGKFEEAKRLVIAELKQSPSSELLEYQAALRALESQNEEVRATVDEIKSSYDKRKQEAWEQEVLEYQARWEEEYRLANPDDSEVRAANYLLSQKPHIIELNNAVAEKKVAAEKDVLEAIVKNGGDGSAGRLLDFLRTKERYQLELDKIAGAISHSKRVESTPVVEAPAFVEEQHVQEEVQPVVEQEVHQELPSKEEVAPINDDFDDLDAEFEKEFAALDAAPVSLESTLVVESQPEVSHEEVAHEAVSHNDIDENDFLDEDFEDFEESPKQHEDLGDSFDELGDEEEHHEAISHDDEFDVESDEDDFDDFAEYKDDEDEEVEAPKSGKKLGLGAKIGIGAGAVGLLAAVGVGGVMLLNQGNDQKANEPSTSEQAPAEKSDDTTVKPLVSVGDTLVITKADKKEYTVKVLEVLPDGSIYTDGGDNGEKIHITYEQLQKKFGQ